MLRIEAFPSTTWLMPIETLNRAQLASGVAIAGSYAPLASPAALCGLRVIVGRQAAGS